MTTDTSGTSAIDRKTAVARLGGDESLFEEFARSVVLELPGMLEIIQSSLATGDLAETHRAAHGLKGMLATLEARPSTAAAAELERITQQQNAAAAPAAFERLKQELTRLQTALKDLPPEVL